jgi:hypothetical protein
MECTRAGAVICMSVGEECCDKAPAADRDANTCKVVAIIGARINDNDVIAVSEKPGICSV